MNKNSILIIFLVILATNIYAKDYNYNYKFKYNTTNNTSSTSSTNQASSTAVYSSASTPSSSSSSISSLSSSIIDIGGVCIFGPAMPPNTGNPSNPSNPSGPNSLAHPNLPQACKEVVEYKTLVAEIEMRNVEDEIRQLLVRTIPSFDDVGCSEKIVDKIMSLLQYVDITQLVNAIQGLSSIVASALSGNFTSVLSAANLTQYYESLKQSFLSASCQQKLCDIALEYLDDTLEQYKPNLRNVQKFSNTANTIYNIAVDPTAAISNKDQFLKDLGLDY